MRISVNLDTFSVAVSPDKVKAAHQPIVILFERGGVPVSLDGASIALGFKPKGVFDESGLVAFHNDFLAETDRYFATVNFATTELHDLLGIGDSSGANDKARIELSGEVAWTLDGVLFCSQTFTVSVEPSVIAGTAPTPVIMGEALLRSDLGTPGGAASLNELGKVPSDQLPDTPSTAEPGEVINVLAASGATPVALTHGALVRLSLAGNATLQQSSSAAVNTGVNIRIVSGGHQLAFGTGITVKWINDDAPPSVLATGTWITLICYDTDLWEGAWGT